MRRYGYLRVDGPDGRFEADVLVCSHCQRAIEVQPRTPAVGGYCASCDAWVCETCKTKGECMPFRARVDRQLEAEARRRQLAQVLGL